MAIYIGVAVIVGLLIGFVTLMLVWLADKVGASIRQKTLEIVSMYDELLEEKSHQLGQLTSQAEQVYKNMPETRTGIMPVGDNAAGAMGSMLGTAEMISATEYLDMNLVRQYRRIKELFSFDPAEIISHYTDEELSAQPGPATRLIHEMGREVFYELSCLPEDRQLQILKDHLTGDYGELINGFAGGHTGIKALEFYDWLTCRADEEPQVAILYLPPNSSFEAKSGINVIYDDDICEGFQLEVNHVLYNYSLRRSEVS